MAAARRARPSGRHSAPRRKSAQSRNLRGVALFFTLTSVIVVGSTAGSAAPYVAVQADFEYQPAAKPSPTSTVVSSASMPTRPLRHASRSDHRLTITANAPVPASVDPNAATDTTPTLTTTQRFALRAVAPTTQSLNSLVEQTLNSEERKAKHRLAVIAAKKAAIEAAKAEKEAQQNQQTGGGPVLSPSDGNARGTNGYLYSSSICPLSAKEISTEADALGERQMPIKGSYKLSARFGERGYMWSAGWHTGLDFDVPTGSRVVASLPGTIVAAGWAGPYGYHIEIDHGNGYITTYSHLSRIEKSSGFVDAGEEIGRSGSTGNTSGPHLHFEVYRMGLLVNPAIWLWGTN